MKTIRRYFNNAEAGFAQSLLVSAGIGAVLAEENAINLGPQYVPFGVRLQVPDEEAARALEILDGRSDEFAPLPEDFVEPDEVPVGSEAAPPPRREGFNTLRGLIPAGLCVVGVIGAVCVVFISLAPLNWTHSAAELVRMGNAAADKKDYARAVKCYDAALVANPKSWTAHYDRGLSFYDNGDLEKAVADFTESIRLNPLDAKSYRLRGYIYAKMSEFDKALEDLDKAVSLDPESSAGYLGRGRVYYAREEWDKALEDFNELIELNPKDYAAYCERGLVYWQMGKYEQALNDYDKSIRLNANSPSVYVYLAYFHSRKEEFDKALDDVNEALKLDSKHVLAYQERGFVFYWMHDYNKALDEVNKAISIDPKRYQGYVVRGMIYSRKGDASKALEDYNRVVELAPHAWAGYNSLAWLYATFPKAEVRDGAKAMELAGKACELSNWKDFYCIGTLAAAEAETGEFDDAVKHQQQVLEMADKKVNATLFGEMTDALACYQQKKPYRDVRK